MHMNLIICSGLHAYALHNMHIHLIICIYIFLFAYAFLNLLICIFNFCICICIICNVTTIIGNDALNDIDNRKFYFQL